MSKRSYKKIKTETSEEDGRLREVAQITRRSTAALKRYFKPEEFKGITTEQLKFIKKTISTYSKSTHIDYLHFLLNPITSPRKVRMPGYLTNPLGTEVREFKHFTKFVTKNANYDTKFCWSPGQYNFSQSSSYPSFGMAQQKKAYSNPTDLAADFEEPLYIGAYWPSETKMYFNSARLIGAELRMNVMQANLTAIGRAVVSPIYVVGHNSSGVAIVPAGVNYSAIDRPIDELFDNKIVYDTPIMDGLRMVYFPASEKAKDFIPTTNVYSTDAQGPHETRMDYNGIIRGLPIGTTIEIYLVAYFEFTVNEKYYEIVASADNERPGVTLGSMNDVMASLQEIDQILPKTFSLNASDDLGKDLVILVNIFSLDLIDELSIDEETLIINENGIPKKYSVMDLTSGHSFKSDNSILRSKDRGFVLSGTTSNALTLWSIPDRPATFTTPYSGPINLDNNTRFKKSSAVRQWVLFNGMMRRQTSPNMGYMMKDLFWLAKMAVFEGRESLAGEMKEWFGTLILAKKIINDAGYIHPFRPGRYMTDEEGYKTYFKSWQYQSAYGELKQPYLGEGYSDDWTDFETGRGPKADIKKIREFVFGKIIAATGLGRDSLISKEELFTLAEDPYIGSLLLATEVLGVTDAFGDKKLNVYPKPRLDFTSYQSEWYDKLYHSRKADMMNVVVTPAEEKYFKNVVEKDKWPLAIDFSELGIWKTFDAMEPLLPDAKNEDQEAINRFIEKAEDAKEDIAPYQPQMLDSMIERNKLNKAVSLPYNRNREESEADDDGYDPWTELDGANNMDIEL